MIIQVNMIAITTTLIFSLLALFLLIKLSVQDVKTQEVENREIIPLLVIGLAFSLINKNLLPTLVLMSLTWLVGLYLWKRGCFGGADVKILPCIIPFMNFQGLGDTFGKMFFFMIFFGIIGTVYGLIAKKMLKKENAPFVPIITLVYLIFMIRYLFI